MKQVYAILVSLIFVTILSAMAEEQVNIQVIYPQNNATINAPSTFIQGNTSPKATLTINNKEVKVYSNGSFVENITLKRGINTLKIKSTLNKKTKVLTYRINTPQYEKSLPHSPLRIIESSITPNKDITFQPGDTIQVRFKGSPGNKATFSIGNITNIPMTEQPAKYSRTKAAFGKSFLSSKKPISGIYNGVYIIQKSDNFEKTSISIKLSSNKGSITKIANSRISVMPDNAIPVIGEVKKDNAVVRTSPDASRLTPLLKGTRLNITGKIGDCYRFSMGEIMEGWILASDINILPAGTPLAQSTITSISTETRPDSVLIKIPLTQKLPIYIEQIPGPQMILSIYGGSANIDLYSYNPDADFIKELKWTQPCKNTFKLIIQPCSNQFWGYNYYYEDNTLVLKLKKPCAIDANNPLKNKIITLDPGHGGSETGSIGPTGIPEKTVNLAIAKYLKTMLEDSGAKVIMTRETDDINPGLYERSDIARANNSQILLSIHNNALPNGRDPYKEHGSSTYYYHSQALPLAKNIQNSLVQNLGLKDFGIFWDSLALTRPNDPISVLVEVGFMINPDEYLKLTTPTFQKKSARAIYTGLENFYKSQL